MRFGRFPVGCLHFVKLNLDSFTDSVVPAFTAGYPANEGGINSQLFSDAGEESPLCYVGTNCHLPCHGGTILQIVGAGGLDFTFSILQMSVRLHLPTSIL